MRPTYEQELDALPETWATVMSWDAGELRTALARLASGPAAFTASGGMLAVSTLAAQLHEHMALEPACALTPLGLVSRPAIPSSGAVLFTSSGKHPDANEVMRRLGRPGLHPGVVLTHQQAVALPATDAKVITLPPLPVREGFLAVNSVLAMALAVVRGYLGDDLAAQLSPPDPGDWPGDVDRMLVLYPPNLGAVAADVETRASEVGLAAVQTADYRNFAHGRHTGLERTLNRTTIVALTDPASEDLANATLAVLPLSAEIVRWHSHARWPVSAVELLVVSMRACGQLGARQQVSLAQPKVPVFGRRLYRLPIRRRLPDVRLGPVERKLGSAGAGVPGNELRDSYQAALDSWRKDLDGVRFEALVLDYDGTVCTTEGRFFPPEPPIAKALNRLLGEGFVLGFASGRGPSMHNDLRKVIDPAHWRQVRLGFYNGGFMAGLDEELEDLKEPTALIAEVHERLRELPMACALRCQPRRVQLTVEPGDRAWVKPALLAEIVTEALARGGPLPVKVVRSGHSLDIVPLTTSKVSVIECVRTMTSGAVLAVGDQGQIGGNDFELLAHDRWSLSVDRCSGDPTRCWYLGDGSLGGPRQLLRYIGALAKRVGGHSLRVGTFT